MGDPESWSVPATRFGPRYYYTKEGISQAKETYLRSYRPKDPGPDDWKDHLVFGPMTEAPEVSDETLYDGKVANAAIAALQERKKASGQPFFLAVGFIKPAYAVRCTEKILGPLRPEYNFYSKANSIAQERSRDFPGTIQAKFGDTPINPKKAHSPRRIKNNYDMATMRVSVTLMRK